MKRRRIPNALNLTLLAVISWAAVKLLQAASHSEGLILLPIALAFGYVNHTMYALLHEAVHNSLNSSKSINDWGGRWAAAFFPTSYRLQRAFHLTHHRFNRTESEQWDYLRPGDNKFLKLAQWYAIMTGLYWVFIPLVSLLYLAWPGLLKKALLRQTPLAQQTSSDNYLESLDGLDPKLARGDVFFTIALQASLFLLLGVSLKGWAICYAAFAFMWSSLQYADHAFSPLDV